MSHLPTTTADPWAELRRLTSARIALGRAGGSVPTAALLDFELAHARARDSVHAPFDAGAMKARIESLGVEAVVLAGAAGDRQTYLQRPDLGRRLSDESRQVLQEKRRGGAGCDVALIVSDGLAALAAHRQAAPLLAELLPALRSGGLTVGPVAVVAGGRVAIQDEIGQILGARAALILLGERPGLASPDSLGAYLVYDPKPGRTDAQRNCVSNIRPQGLPPAAAARALHALLTQAIMHRLSGVGLKGQENLLAPRS